jgi:N-acetylated-alpha-linked acidic dipeptidase
VIAVVTAGWACPVALTAMPALKSRKRLPSTSSSRTPAPRSTTIAGKRAAGVYAYVEAARRKSAAVFGAQPPDFAEAIRAAHRFEQSGAKIHRRQENPGNGSARLNQALRQAERALLIPEGLPNRPWFRHAIYAPGQYTGYAAVVIPGVNEAIDKHDLERTRQQIAVLAAVLNRAARVLEDYR